ncbi:integrase core domain-containing protein, partial [Erythrobacter westpacificensis]
GRYAPLSPSRRALPSRGSFPMCYGHEFQAKFHWHVEDLGIRHAYIKPSSPQLNGKVERSHRSDSQEFYQLLTYKGDVDLEERLDEWERFYNFHRTHGAFNGKTPHEALREKL